jgi:hypothetical protein
VAAPCAPFPAHPNAGRALTSFTPTPPAHAVRALFLKCLGLWSSTEPSRPASELQRRRGNSRGGRGRPALSLSKRGGKSKVTMAKRLQSWSKSKSKSKRESRSRSRKSKASSRHTSRTNAMTPRARDSLVWCRYFWNCVCVRVCFFFFFCFANALESVCLDWRNLELVH